VALTLDGNRARKEKELPDGVSTSQRFTFLAKQNRNRGELGLLVGATFSNLEIKSKRKQRPACTGFSKSLCAACS